MTSFPELKNLNSSKISRRERDCPLLSIVKHIGLQSNSVTRQVTFYITNIGRKCQNSKPQMRHFGYFQTLFSNFIEFVRHFWPLLTIVEAKVSPLFHIQKLIWAKGLTNVQSVPKSQGNLLPVVKVSRNKLFHWVPNNRKPNGLHSNKLRKIDEVNMSIIS